MTSSPQTRQRTLPAQDGRRRTSPAAGSPETFSPARARAREPLPTVDPSMAYGCVDWFLYPDQAEAQPRAGRA